MRSGDVSRLAYQLLAAGDTSTVRDVFDGLGPESRYLRYHGVKPQLSEQEVRYFSEVDHHDHEAVVAVAGTEPVGIAFYVRRHDDVRAADVAVEVVDEWHRQGIGSRLLRTLARRAREEHVDRLYGTILQSNVAMMETLRRFRGPSETTSRAGPVVEIAVDLQR